MEYLSFVAIVMRRILAIDVPFYNLVKVAGVLCLSTYTVLLGQIDRQLMESLAILICLDWILGLFIAIKFRKLNSRSMVKGAVKLAIYFFLLCVSNAILYSKCGYFIAGMFIHNIVTCYIIMTEVISICENLLIIALSYDLKFPLIDIFLKYIELQEKKIYKLMIENINDRKKKK